VSAAAFAFALQTSARGDQIPVPVVPAASASTQSGAPSGAPAPQRPATALVVNAEVMVLYATMAPGAGSIDPALGKMSQLRKPPFSVFNTYRLLDKKVIPIELGRTGPYLLPNGRVLQVTFANPTQDRRFHVQVAIEQPGGKAYLKLLEVTAGANETFFVAGQPYKDGILVLGLTMRP